MLKSAGKVSPNFNQSPRIHYVPVAVYFFSWCFVPFSGLAFTVKNHVAVTFLLSLTLAHSFRLKSFQFPPFFPFLMAVGLLASLAISLIDAVNPTGAAWASVRASVFVLLCLTLWGVRPDSDSFKKAVGLAGTGVALFGFKQVLFPSFLNPGFIDLGKMQVYSTLGNPTYVAFFLIGAIPFTLSWLISTHKDIGKAFLALALVVQVACLVTTQSRHSILALALGGAITMGHERINPSRRFYGFLLLMLGVAVITVIQGRGILPLALALKGRGLVWFAAANVFLHHPWTGIGLENFTLHYMDAQAVLLGSSWGKFFYPYAGFFLDAHSEYLEWFIGTGLLGGVAFLGITLWVLVKSFQHSDRVPWEWRVVLVSSLMAFASSSVLHCAPLALLYWFTVGHVGSSLPQVGPVVSINRPIRFCLSMAIASLMTWAIWFSVRSWRGALAERRGDVFLAERDVWLARASFRTAVDYAPWDGDLRQKYATVLYLDKDDEQALAQLTKAEKLSGNPGILTLKAELLAMRGNSASAIALYERLTRAFPNMTGPHFMLAQLYQAKGMDGLAQSHYKQIIEIKPSDYNLGMTKSKVTLQKTIARDTLKERWGIVIDFPPLPETGASNRTKTH